MTAQIEIREDLWPVLFVRILGPVNDSGWRAMFAAYARFYARGQRYCCVTDTTGLRAVPDAASRGLIASLAKVHEPDSRRWIIQSHVVVDSALGRGAMTAITWLAPPVYPITYVATTKEAMVRTLAALEREGRGIPESVRVFAASLV